MKIQHINEVNTDVYTAWTEDMYIDNQLKEYSAEDNINHRHFASLKRELNDIKKEYYSADN